MSSKYSDIGWYPMYASFGRQMKVKAELDRLKIECFVPMRYGLVNQDGANRRELVPAISNLIFVHSSRELITELKMFNDACRPLQYMVRKSRFDSQNNEILIVPDGEMRNFIRVTAEANDQVEFLELTDFLNKEGRRVRVIEGMFQGVEGVVKRIQNNRKVVVVLKNVAAVAITHLEARMLEFLD